MEASNFGKWIKTETMTTTKYHYFPKGTDESLCGKLFNLEKKIKKEVDTHCSECKGQLKKYVTTMESQKQPDMYKEIYGEEECITIT